MAELRAIDEILVHAACAGDVEEVKRLIADGADVNAYELRGDLLWSPLYCAVANGRSDVVKLLLEAGASVGPISLEFETPLHVAARRGDLDVVILLVEHGAEVNAKSRDGLTPLHYAAESGSVEVVEYLVGQGADVNATDWDGATSLHKAAANGYLDVIKVLVEHGAKVNARTRFGEAPLCLAAEGCHVDVVSYLLKHSADPSLCSLEGLCAEARKMLAEAVAGRRQGPVRAGKLPERPYGFRGAVGLAPHLGRLQDPDQTRH